MESRFVQARDGSVAHAMSGELIEHAYTAVLMPKRRNGFGERWMAMGQDAATTLAKQGKELGLDGFRVFMHLVGVLRFDNLIQVNQAEIAGDLEMHRQHVQRAIKRLITVGALLEGPRIGVHRTYRLNPSYGWKGSGKSHQTALEARMKAAGLSVVGKGPITISGQKNDDDRKLTAADLEAMGQARLFP